MSRKKKVLFWFCPTTLFLALSVKKKKKKRLNILPMLLKKNSWKLLYESKYCNNSNDFYLFIFFTISYDNFSKPTFVIVLKKYFNLFRTFFYNPIVLRIITLWLLSSTNPRAGLDSPTCIKQKLCYIRITNPSNSNFIFGSLFTLNAASKWITQIRSCSNKIVIL